MANASENLRPSGNGLTRTTRRGALAEHSSAPHGNGSSRPQPAAGKHPLAANVESGRRAALEAALAQIEAQIQSLG